jgi:hypothetical protein
MDVRSGKTGIAPNDVVVQQLTGSGRSALGAGLQTPPQRPTGRSPSHPCPEMGLKSLAHLTLRR